MSSLSWNRWKKIRAATVERLTRRLWTHCRVLLDFPDQLQEAILLEVIVMTSRDHTQFVDDIRTSLSLVCRKWKTIVSSADFDGQLKKLLAKRNPNYRYRVQTREYDHHYSIDLQDVPMGRMCVYNDLMFTITKNLSAVRVYKLLSCVRDIKLLQVINRLSSRHPASVRIQQIQVYNPGNELLLYALISAMHPKSGRRKPAKTPADRTFVNRILLVHDDQLSTIEADLTSNTRWLVNDVTPTTCDMTVAARSGDVIVAARTERRVFVFDRDGVLRRQIDLTALFDAPPNNRTRDSIVSMCVVRLAAEEDAYIVMTTTASWESIAGELPKIPEPSVSGFLTPSVQLLNSVVNLWPTTLYGLRLSKIRCTSPGDPLEIMSQRKFEQCIPLVTSDPDCPIYVLDSTAGLLTRRVLRLGPDLDTRPGVGIIEGIPANVQVGDPQWPRFDPETKSFFVCRQRPNLMTRLCQRLISNSTS